MALNFVGGKPVKVDKKIIPVEEIKTPAPPPSGDFKYSDKELAAFLLEQAQQIKAATAVPGSLLTAQEPEKIPIYVNVTHTVAPAPSIFGSSGILNNELYAQGVTPPPGTVLADGTTTYLSKLQIPVSELTVEDQVKLSQDQEPQSIAVEQAHSEVLTLVDEYTELQAEIDAVDISAQLKAQETIKKRLAQIAKSDNYPSNKPVQLCGTHGNYVEFSAAANSVKITDKAGMAMYLGAPVWIEHTEMTLAEAKKILSENELAKYTSNVPGSRTLKTVYKG
jgi:hypothetical protein